MSNQYFPLKTKFIQEFIILVSQKDILQPLWSWQYEKQQTDKKIITAQHLQKIYIQNGFSSSFNKQTLYTQNTIIYQQQICNLQLDFLSHFHNNFDQNLQYKVVISAIVDEFAVKNIPLQLIDRIMRGQFQQICIILKNLLPQDNINIIRHIIGQKVEYIEKQYIQQFTNEIRLNKKDNELVTDIKFTLNEQIQRSQKLSCQLYNLLICYLQQNQTNRVQDHTQ